MNSEIKEMILKEGFQIVEGGEGQYDKLVKLNKEYIVEIVYFPHERSTRIDENAFHKIHQINLNKTIRAFEPEEVPLREYKKSIHQ